MIRRPPATGSPGALLWTEPVPGVLSTPHIFACRGISILAGRGGLRHTDGMNLAFGAERHG